MNEDNFRKLISGRNKGLAAKLLCLPLNIFACLYSTVIRLRNFLYNKGLLKEYPVDVPVISIGNITTGGTGKTPLVIWLGRWLEQKKIPYAILTRGYKTTQNSKLKTQNCTDEPAVLIESCPEAKVVVNPDRVAGAFRAINEFGAQVLVMDDGFQHRRLRRDLDIVTIDSTNPFGYGKILPAGLLREPAAALKRAAAVVLTRCEQRSDGELNKLESELKTINPDLITARTVHRPVYAGTLENEKISLEQLNDKEAFAFCGIGNPDAFEATLKRLKIKLVGFEAYNDHHHYTAGDIAGVYRKAGRLNARFILTTQKDRAGISAAQLPTMQYPDVIFAYLAIELKFVTGENKITQLLENAIQGKIRKS